MKNFMFKITSFFFALCFFVQGLFAAGLTRNDIKKIIMSSTNVSQWQAKIMVQQLEKMYGLSENKALNVSGVLTGSRRTALEWKLFTSKTDWKFNASFIPRGSTQVVTVPELVEAQFLNGGFSINVLSYDWIILIFPKGFTIEQFHELNTSRGILFPLLSFLPFLPGFAYTNIDLITPLSLIHFGLGFVHSSKGNIGILASSLGFKLAVFPFVGLLEKLRFKLPNFLGVTFPKFHFKINKKYLSP